MKKNAIFYFINECSEYTIEQYNYFINTNIDIFILIDNKNINIDKCINEFKNAKDIYSFDKINYIYNYDELKNSFTYNKFNIIKDYIKQKEENLLNEYEYIYLIDPTIKYSNSIIELFNELDKSSYDYISTYIQILTDSTINWTWYNVFKQYFCEKDYGKILKSYDGGFTRLSSKSLNMFIYSNDDIFNYLFELSYPTMCYNNGFSIGSLSSCHEDNEDFHFMNICHNDTYYYNTNHIDINESFYKRSNDTLFNTYKRLSYIIKDIKYKTDNPYITVIMPIYNAEKTVKQAIDSVINQNYFYNYELWCLNDGSTDNTLNILYEYKNHPNVNIINLEHKGIVQTLNYAINKVNSKYIVRMDADDIMLPERLLHQYNYMESHLECDILGSSMYINDNDEVYNMHDYEILLEYLIGMNRIVHPATCFRTKSIKKLPFIYEDYYEYCEDYKLWVTALLHGLRIFSDSTPVIRYTLVHKSDNDNYRNTQDDMSNKIKNLVNQICNGITNENNNITAIISFRNEYEEIEKTVASLRATTNNMPIILLNDASDKDYDYKFVADKYHCKYMENETPSGCAGARNDAVKHVETDYFILLDGHMRTYENDWDKRALEIIKEHGKNNIYFGTSIVISKNEYNEYTNETGKQNNKTYGCVLSGETYTLTPKWTYNNVSENFDDNDNVIPVPIMLGACYICSVKFWNKIRGLDGLLSWGQDETLLSLKTWLSGNKVLLIKDMLFGHVYRSKRPYNANGIEMNSNHIYTNYLFSRNDEEYNELNYILEQALGHEWYLKAYNCFMERFNKAKKFKEYFYNKLAKRTMDWFWDFNYKADPKLVQEHYDKIKEILDKKEKEQS